jgi:hypothetical protein
MPCRRCIGALVLAVSLCWSLAGARAFDDNKYPDLSGGQWLRTDIGTPRFDPSKPACAAARPAEYQVFEAVGRPGAAARGRSGGALPRHAGDDERL